MGPILFVIVCGKRKVEMIRSFSAFRSLKLRLWFHVAPDREVETGKEGVGSLGP